jgi:hypothetical protein
VKAMVGNILLLAGYYPQAKREFRELLLKEKEPDMIGAVLNNLALACWWHKHPSFRDLDDYDVVLPGELD